MSSVDHGNGFGLFLGTFFVGAATGAAIALLTTPRNGREMRIRLKDVAREIGGTMRQIPGAVREAGTRAVRAGQSAFVQAKEEAAQAYNKTPEAPNKEIPRFAK